MKKRNILISILFLILLEIFNIFVIGNKFIWWFFIIFILIILISLLWTVGLPFRKWFSREIITHSSYLVLPFIFTTTSLLFLSLIRSAILQQLFIFGSTLFFYIILIGIRGVILNLDYKIKPRLTYNILSLSTLISSFLIYSLVWAFFRDLSLPVWLVLLIFFFITVLLFYQIFHLFCSLRRRSIIYAIFSALVIIEVVWILCFWPIEYYFLGVLLTIVFYVLWGMIHHKLENKLNRKIIIEYLIVSLIIFFIILRTSLLVLGII